jgi:hypothetical protein
VSTGGSSGCGLVIVGWWWVSTGGSSGFGFVISIVSSIELF